MKKNSPFIVILLLCNLCALSQNPYFLKSKDALQKMKNDAAQVEDYKKCAEIKKELDTRELEEKQIADLKIDLENKIKLEDYDGATKTKELIKSLQETKTKKEQLRKDIAEAIIKEDYGNASKAKQELELLSDNPTRNTLTTSIDETQNELFKNCSSCSSRIAATDGNSIFIKEDGSVWAWGRNDYGQIGDGTKTDRNTQRLPVQLTGITDCIAVSIGSNSFNWSTHALALKKDGTVWAWGNNKSGQLGDGSFDYKNNPVQVKGIEGITAISCGEKFSLALKNDGTVWTWGENKFGQLGIGTNSDSNIPIKINNLEGIIFIAAETMSSIALKNDGTVWTWGNNHFGQLGDGTNTKTNIPVKVNVLNDVVLIAGGGVHSLALKKDGSVWSWGSNFWGQLGDGTKQDNNKPIQVKGLTGVITIKGGSAYSMAIKNDGTAWAWGANHGGQLGDSSISWHEAYNEYLAKHGTLASLASPGVISGGRSINSNTPVKVSGLKNIIGICAGTNHSMAIKNDGSLWIWGENGNGQLGIAHPPFFTNVPIKLKFPQ